MNVNCNFLHITIRQNHFGKMKVMNLIEISALERHYEMASGIVKALDGVDLEISVGERIVLLGPSGSGKTTLLNCVAALDSPTGGKYTFDGKQVPREKSEEMTTFRRENIGYVFQFFNLLQDLTVLENILLIQELSGQKDRERAIELLSLVGLELEIDRFPAEISGGQQQRVAIARALVQDPAFVLADEPTGNLDKESGINILNILKELNNQGKTVIMITHNQEHANMFKKVIELVDGKIVN